MPRNPAHFVNIVRETTTNGTTTRRRECLGSLRRFSAKEGRN
nr:MAG TPA: hypothetical protein [Caudoviricetes sp.]DAO75626.1 MAG TPA: hypothetical protein [Caudoviricetes sp.]